MDARCPWRGGRGRSGRGRFANSFYRVTGTTGTGTEIGSGIRRIPCHRFRRKAIRELIGIPFRGRNGTFSARPESNSAIAMYTKTGTAVVAALIIGAGAVTIALLSGLPYEQAQRARDRELFPQIGRSV